MTVVCRSDLLQSGDFIWHACMHELQAYTRPALRVSILSEVIGQSVVKEMHD